MHHTIRLSQMRIGVDLDGVVADFTHGWTSQYKKDFGKEILEKDITEWGLSKPLTHFEEEIDFWNWAKDFNGSSIFVLLFGIHHVIMDPSTLELINLIETTFGIDIPYEQFVELVELWKAQIISLCGSIQVFLAGYQQTRQRMKDADTEDTWAFINEELEKL